MNICTKGNKTQTHCREAKGFTTVVFSDIFKTSFNAQNIKTFHPEKSFLTNIFISLSYFTNMYCTRGEIR